MPGASGAALAPSRGKKFAVVSVRGKKWRRQYARNQATGAASVLVSGDAVVPAQRRASTVYAARQRHRFVARLERRPLDGELVRVAHIAFVHRKTFGNMERPRTDGDRDLTMAAFGFETFNEAPVKVRGEIAHRAVHTNSGETMRRNQSTRYMPFVRRLAIHYPHGLIHSIVTCATPMTDKTSMILQSGLVMCRERLSRPWSWLGLASRP
jgi:hypothetical protein